jgi:hypothetical protein
LTLISVIKEETSLGPVEDGDISGASAGTDGISP